MRNLEPLRRLRRTRIRTHLGLSAAIFGLAAAALTVGLSMPSLTNVPGTTSGSVGHRAGAGNGSAHTTTATHDAVTSPYSGGHLMAADPSGGYWTVNWVGDVTAYGGAPSFGSPVQSGITVAKPIVGMAATPDGKGYWLVGTDGGVFSYGDAAFYGSTGALHLNAPIVGIAATPDGAGYWLVASDGGIFTYGDARFFGSAGSLHLNEPIVGMAPTADDAGYWLIASDGGVFTYGDATFSGSLAGGTATVLGVVVEPTTDDYTFVEMSGAAAVPSLTPVANGDAGSASSGSGSSGGASTSTGTGSGSGSGSGTSTTTPASSGTAAKTGTLLEGSYDGAADPSNIAAFDTATGTHSAIASEYLPSNSGWSGMDGAGGSLNWLTSAWEGKGYILSLGVPIIPTDSSGTAQGTLAAGATGAYNSYFVTLAQTLVAAGEGNTYLRLGWEFDGNWYPSWDADSASAEADFASYFDQIVTAMRSVAGEDFKFVWNPDAGAFTESGYNVDLAYPGNAYVDIIGLDAYDESWATPQNPTNAWNDTVGPELAAAHTFAASEGKPLAFCEWGIAFLTNGHGLGDDPLYVNNMAAFMQNTGNDVAYESYFNYDGTSDSILTNGEAPNSLAAFKADFG